MKEAEKQALSEFGKHGGLVIDEMSIQDDLIITKSGDTWHLVGFVDMDKTNNNIDIICHGKKQVLLATHALQYVFHGLTGFRYVEKRNDIVAQSKSPGRSYNVLSNLHIPLDRHITRVRD